MKVILKVDVKGSGKKGDILEVSDGYAKNFLLKKGLAEIATASGINEIQQKKTAEAYHKAENVKALKALADSMKDTAVEVPIKVGENGRVFGSVTSAQVSSALTEKGFEIDKKKILMKDAIKSLGSFPVEIRLMEGITTKIIVNVVPA